MRGQFRMSRRRVRAASAGTAGRVRLITASAFWRTAWSVAVAFLAGMPTLAGGEASANACADGRLRVAIDIGHSEEEPGAVSATGRREFRFNERFAQELVAKSQQRGTTGLWLDLFIHNSRAKSAELAARPRNAERMGGEVFVSIHHDSVQKKHLVAKAVHGRRHLQAPEIRGYSIFVARRNPPFRDSEELATQIGRSFRLVGMVPTRHHAENIPGERREELDREAGVYEAPFTVLTSAAVPAVLIEIGVIANAPEERDLETTEYRAMAQLAILNALEAFCASSNRAAGDVRSR